MISDHWKEENALIKWYEEKGDNSDVVISSRVRLARNLARYPFSTRLSNELALQLVEEVQTEMKDYRNDDGKFIYCNLASINDIDKTAMAERHILSLVMAEKKQDTGLLLAENETVSMMVNEEDHVRIQAFAGGMNMSQAFQKANELDDVANEKLGFSFNEKYGYLTACPTNVGTGMRASYMVFLPALGAVNKIKKLAEEVSKYGVTLRGMYGEGSEGVVDIYQISNQKTLGSSERDIIDNLDSIVAQVIKQERKRREYVLANNYDMIEDQVYRSYGVLKYTKQINAKDAMTLLAQVKFGFDCGILKPVGDYNIYRMMMAIQPANLQYRIGKNVGNGIRDRVRADYLNANLPELKS